MESSATEMISPPPSRPATPELPPVPPPSPTVGARDAFLSRPCVPNDSLHHAASAPNGEKRKGQVNKVSVICNLPLWGITCMWRTYWCLGCRVEQISSACFGVAKDPLSILAVKVKLQKGTRLFKSNDDDDDDDDGWWWLMISTRQVVPCEVMWRQVQYHEKLHRYISSRNISPRAHALPKLLRGTIEAVYRYKCCSVGSTHRNSSCLLVYAPLHSFEQYGWWILIVFPPTADNSYARMCHSRPEWRNHITLLSPYHDGWWWWKPCWIPA